MTRRLVRGVAANLYGQAITVVLQLCTVPALLHLWGSERFGQWLLIVAWTSVLSLADGGFMIASGNAMTAAVARGDPKTAGRIFVQAFRLVIGIATLLGCLTAVALLVAPASLFDRDPERAWDVQAASLALAAAALAGLPLGMAELGFRADAAYAAGVVGTSSVRLAETAAALAIAASGVGLAAAAAALLAVRMCGAGVMMSLLYRRAAWIADTGSAWTWSEIRPLARPALAALAVPAGLSLSIQGTTAAAGCVLVSGAVATFVSARTLTRILVQAVGLVTHALMPEMTMAAGRGDERRATSLVRLNLAAASAVLLPGWIVLVAFGPMLMERWTGGLLRPDPMVMGLIASAAVLHGSWLSVSNMLLATNRQAQYAYIALSLGAVACVLVVILGRAWGLEGVAWAGLTCEGVMALAVVPGQVLEAVRAPDGVRSAGAGS